MSKIFNFFWFFFVRLFTDLCMSFHILILVMLWRWTLTGSYSSLPWLLSQPSSVQKQGYCSPVISFTPSTCKKIHFLIFPPSKLFITSNFEERLKFEISFLFNSNLIFQNHRTEKSSAKKILKLYPIFRVILSSFSAYLALHSILETLASLGETEPVRALAAAFHPALPQLFQFVFCRPFDFHPAPLQQLGPLLVVQSHNRSSSVVSQILKFRNSSREFSILYRNYFSENLCISLQNLKLILTKIYSEPMFITSSVSSSSNRKSTRFLPSSSENDFSVKWRASIAEIPTRFIPIWYFF